VQSYQRDRRGLLISQSSLRRERSSIAELLVPAVLLRAGPGVPAQIVHVYTARNPTVAFSARDLRSSGIANATRIARASGFACVVRSPGGRMVAYDSGAVVIDHITRFARHGNASAASFAENAANHVRVLRSLGDIDARVGEVAGEYCPGEFSINVEGVAKVLGSAQRVTADGALFSTVVQVEMSERVRRVLVAVSAALDYPLSETSIAGLTDFAPSLTPSAVADTFRADYRARLSLTDEDIPDHLAAHVEAATEDGSGLPFRVDDWARAHPLSVAGSAEMPTRPPRNASRQT
jgi:octanoyl-[GcvH]:protein N-octanoyltransferase